ncbi:MAG: hypothetical protein QXV69_06825 [Sulfolobaceae archaeon]
MSTRWIPSWKVVLLKLSADKELEVCYDEVTKLYACPICSPECKKGLLPGHGSYFFNIEDLKLHIEAHKSTLWAKVKKVEVEEEEEEEREEEEEEEE